MASATETKQMASAALTSFLRARTAKVPNSDVSRALRRKQQRERKKRLRNHAPANTGEVEMEGNSESRLSKTALKKDPKRSTISKEERDIRQRILQMRENKRKGKPIIQPKNSAADSDESDDDF